MSQHMGTSVFIAVKFIMAEGNPHVVTNKMDKCAVCTCKGIPYTSNSEGTRVHTMNESKE